VHVHGALRPRRGRASAPAESALTPGVAPLGLPPLDPLLRGGLVSADAQSAYNIYIYIRIVLFMRAFESSRGRPRGAICEAEPNPEPLGARSAGARRGRIAIAAPSRGSAPQPQGRGHTYIIIYIII